MTAPPFVMTPRIALVTGGTGGIGTAVCRALTDAGCLVYANYFQLTGNKELKQWQQDNRQDGYVINTVQADVSDPDQIQVMIDTIIASHGRLDILINTAGITRDASFKKMQPQDWIRVIEVNLIGTMNATHAAINIMLEQNYGRIVNISSVNGRKGQFGQTNYSASKAGVHGFTKALAQEVARKGVTVNTVSPGYTSTPMVQNMPHNMLEQIIKEIPIGRLAIPEEIAHAVTFLCDEKSSYITGAELSVNGGMHMF